MNELENLLIPNPFLGILQQPLSAVVFHFSKYSSRNTFRPCEAAYLGSSAHQDSAVKSINVYVSPSNLANMTHAYSRVPGANVRCLKFQSKDLNISSILSLMSVTTTGKVPLYIQQVSKILRNMANGGMEDFDFAHFKQLLNNTSFSPDQRRPLEMRLGLLETFLFVNDAGESMKFEPGEVTVIDMSCPFLDEPTACVLFDVCLGLYLGNTESHSGKVIALDEAHKYINNTPAAETFTESLLSVIRLQRHYGARVLISTQEPSISPKLLDLCSLIVVHRFSSPEWLLVLSKHICIDKIRTEGIYHHILELGVGEALIFSPFSMVSWSGGENPQRLNSASLKVKVRKRLTSDGGKSVVCVEMG